jgi:hypothetical protein
MAQWRRRKRGAADGSGSEAPPRHCGGRSEAPLMARASDRRRVSTEAPPRGPGN